MLKAYLLALFELAQRDSQVIHVIGDSGTGNDQLFQRDFTEQFLDFGISEHHMLPACCGLACTGKSPFFNDDNSPTNTSLLISKPTEKKKTAIKKSLMKSIKVNGTPP